MPFPWKIIRKKVPYEGRTCQSNRAGKTRTALLETRSAKSMRVNNRMQNFVFFNVINENENSASNLSTLANCPLQNYFRRQLTTTMNPERKRTLLTNAEVYKLI